MPSNRRHRIRSSRAADHLTKIQPGRRVSIEGWILTRGNAKVVLLDTGSLKSRLDNVLIRRLVIPRHDTIDIAHGTRNLG